MVGDARYLPFADKSVDVVFSYSVLQHFSLGDADQALRAAARVLRPGGTCLIQLAQATGPLNLFRQAQRRFRHPRAFEVRYWSPRRLRDRFRNLIGPTTFEVDGFFTLNPQPSDVDLLPWSSSAIVRASELLRRVSAHVPWLVVVADSTYCRATRRAEGSAQAPGSTI